MVKALGPDSLKRDNIFKKINQFLSMINDKIPNLEVSMDSYSQLFVDFVIPDPGLDLNGLNVVKSELIRAGWKSVRFFTSRENGETPGLIRITLYLKN